MKYYILFTLVAVSYVALGADFIIRPEGRDVTLHGPNGDSATVMAAKLFYKDQDGTGPTAEDYLVEILNGVYPSVLDKLDGRISKIELADRDDIKDAELLVYYFAGAHQFGVRVYIIDGIEVKSLKSQPLSSNMHSVLVKGKDIVVEDEQIDSDGIRFVS